MTPTAAARAIGVTACFLIAITGALASGFSLFAIPFVAWGLAPFGALYAAARLVTNPWPIAGAGVLALAVEAGTRAAVFLFPENSTAAIALVFSPLWIGAIVMPAGAAAGWALGYVFARAGVIVRLASAAAAIAIVGLTFIGFARPDMFPTTVAARRRALDAIGEPRVVAGGDRYTRIPVSSVNAWHVVGDFDDRSGEDLAAVDHKGAQIVDAITMQPGRFLPFGGEPGRLWDGYSRLIKRGDGFAAVQTGGGYSETELRSLDNAIIWRFHPDPQLPPTALLPGDLDGDGEMEFYASTSGAVTRLNIKGEQVWNRPSTLPDLLELVAPDAAGPAWIVSTRYGVSVDVWSPDGTSIAEMKWPDGRVHGVVGWLGARSLVAGDSTARGFAIDGTTRFEIPVDDPLRVMQVTTWKPSAGSPELLVLVAGGDRHLERWRMRVYASPDAVVYEEVFNAWPRAFKARAADGTATLFIKTGDTLSVLRPVNTSR